MQIFSPNIPLLLQQFQDELDTCKLLFKSQLDKVSSSNTTKKENNKMPVGLVQHSFYFLFIYSLEVVLERTCPVYPKC